MGERVDGIEAYWRQFACERLLARNPDVTAIVAGNDMLAVGCLTHFKEQAIECLNAISLVGMNDLLFMDAVNPGMTTIDADRRTRQPGSCHPDRDDQRPTGL